MYIGLHNINNT